MEAHYDNVQVTWNKDRKDLMCSPEHLFTAAVSSCFMTTFLSIAENSKLAFKSFQCEANGKSDQVEGKLFMTEVLINPILTIFDEKDRDRAMRVLLKTESSCLITNSTKSSVVMRPSI